MTKLILAALALFLSGHAAANAPRSINYQGFLTDKTTGLPIDGARDMDFRLYTAETGGTLLLNEARCNSERIGISKGRYQVFIGTTIPGGGIDPATFASHGALWLEIGVDTNNDCTGFETLSPRIRLQAAPYAFEALHASTATHLAVTGNMAGVSASTNLFVTNGGWLGVGTTAPDSEVHMRFDINEGAGYTAQNDTNGTDARTGYWMASATSEGGIVAVPSAHTLFGGHFADRVALLAADTTLSQYGRAAAGLDIGAADAAGDVRFYAGGFATTNERLRLTSAGRLALNATNPGTARLWLQGAIADDFHVQVSSQDGTGSLLTVAKSGNVGIGTASPQYNLSIYRPLNATLNVESLGVGNAAQTRYAGLENGGNTQVWQAGMNVSVDYGGFEIFDAQNGNTALFVSTNTHYIGIDTVTPQSKLTVIDGDIRLSTTSGSRGIFFQNNLRQTVAYPGNLANMVIPPAGLAITLGGACAGQGSEPNGPTVTATITPAAGNRRLRAHGYLHWNDTGGAAQSVCVDLCASTLAAVCPCPAGGNPGSVAYSAAALQASLWDGAAMTALIGPATLGLAAWPAGPVNFWFCAGATAGIGSAAVVNGEIVVSEEP